jgi:peptidoglycan/LPS O-acetylase OafA/YrhL
MPRGKLGYRPALDGLRGVAILTVLGWHSVAKPIGGALGVDLFFVLSGFLITALLLQEHLETGRVSFLDFYARRAVRLLPALFALLLVLIPYLLVADHEHRRRAVVTMVGALTYTSNLLGLLALDDVAPALQHLWSLAQEEQFYLVWPPLLLFVLARRPKRLPAVLLTLISVVVVERLLYVFFADDAGLGRIYIGPDMHADPLLVGCLFGVVYAHGRLPAVLRTRRRRTITSSLCLTLVLGWMFLVGPEPEAFVYATPALTLFAVAAGFLVLAAAVGDDPTSRLLSVAPLRFLGRISYSLYLWHLPIFFAFHAVGGSTLRDLIAVPAAIAAASLSYFAVERPALRLKDRRRARSRQQGSPSVPFPSVEPALLTP